MRPVLVGAGQITDRPDDPEQGLEPLALMAEAARRAAEDAHGGRALLDAVDTVAVVTNVFHDYGDTATLLAERLGCRPARTLVTTWGGNTPQSLLNHLCDEIAVGRSALALLVGGEAVDTLRRLGKAGRQPTWTERRETNAPRWGDMRPGMSDLEVQHGAREAYVGFAMVENAFRASRRLSLDAHRQEMAAFGGRCAAIAARNPHAWFRDGKDAATIGTVTPANRMVAFPYPKFMNAILEVNQGAALLVAGEATAQRLGLAPERWVYPWAGVDVTELWYLSERASYPVLPGMQHGAGALLETVGVALAQVRHLDLYSCFPIAARLSAAMLGLESNDPRPLTQTGGLPWFGGPGNNYTTHAIASLMSTLRADPGSFGLVHALGWNVTKHALAVYSTAPPPKGWQRAGGPALQAWVDAQAHPEVANEASGHGSVELYTVVHGRDGAPERGVAIGLLDDRRRFVAVLPTDRDVLEGFEREEGVGRRGTVRREGGRNLFNPS